MSKGPKLKKAADLPQSCCRGLHNKRLPAQTKVLGLASVVLKRLESYDVSI